MREADETNCQCDAAHRRILWPHSASDHDTTGLLRRRLTNAEADERSLDCSLRSLYLIRSQLSSGVTQLRPSRMGYLTYVCLCRVKPKPRYFLWQTDLESDAPDRVLIDIAGRISSFGTEAAARRSAAARGEPAVAEPPVVYDLDRLAAWCDHPGEATLDCEAALSAWNLFADLPAPPTGAPSIFGRADRSTGALYDKLFFGNNLPSVTPEGAAYTPLWSDEELTRLSHTLRLGLAEFTQRISLCELSNER